MKVVLAGATGFVGGAVLTRLLAAREVDGVTCLLRKPTGRAHPKLTEHVQSDFTRYDDAQVAALAGHRACIWALGGKASGFPSAAAHEEVTCTMTLAFARAMAAPPSGAASAPGSSKRARPFSFVYVSGMGADVTGAGSPWFEQATRRAKGRTERELFALHAQRPAFAATIVRPGGVLPVQSGIAGRVALRVLGRWVVRVDVLAAALVRCALEGALGAASAPRVLSNDAIAAIAAEEPVTLEVVRGRP